MIGKRAYPDEEILRFSIHILKAHGKADVRWDDPVNIDHSPNICQIDEDK